MSKKHRNKPKKKQRKKKDRSVSRKDEISVVWKDKVFNNDEGSQKKLIAFVE